MIEAEISLEYEDEEMARTVHLSILPDNGPHVLSELRGGTVTLWSSAPSAPSMMHTLNDLLACVKVAEEAFRVGRPP